MGEGVVGVEIEGPAELGLGPFPVVLIKQIEDGERGVGLGRAVVELDCSLGGSLRFGSRLRGGQEPLVITGPEVGVGQPREGGTKSGLSSIASSKRAIAFWRFSSLGRLKKYRPLR